MQECDVAGVQAKGSDLTVGPAAIDVEPGRITLAEQPLEDSGDLFGAAGRQGEQPAELLQESVYFLICGHALFASGPELNR